MSSPVKYGVEAQARQVLLTASELIERQDHLAKSVAQDDDGCFCCLGAINESMTMLDADDTPKSSAIYSKALLLMGIEIQCWSISVWNDRQTTTQAVAVAALHNAGVIV